MIEVTNLTVGYGKKSLSPVLKNLSCSIPAEKISVLVGPNGSGKSTLLKTICGFLPVWNGSVQLDGKLLSDYALSERAKKIAYLSQSRRLPEITVRSLVLHGRFPYTHFPRHYTKEDCAVADSALSAMGLDSIAEKKLSCLSGGQQQKVFLAMALAQQTSVLVLDEPLTFLDIRQQLELLHLLKKLCAQGKTILLVVHDLHTALTFADKLIVMSGGEVISEGTPALIAEKGTIDTVFCIHTEKISLPKGENLYTFSTELV